MIYPEHIIETIRERSGIVDVVAGRVQLTKKGKYFFGLCPFHGEKTPSFSVDPERQIYYCYSCNRGGDVFRFLMETERITFPEAIQKLAERVHVELPASSDPAENRALALAKARQERLFAMNAEAAGFFSGTLTSAKGGPGRAYLQRRAIRPDTVKKFGIGFSPDEWDGLTRFLSSKGYTDEEQLSGGLILKNKNGGYYDRFRNRVMFPIIDVSGRVVAFGGRVLDDSVPKYMNSPETPVYSKGKMLFGLNFAKATREKFFLIVEGYMDLIALAANGIDNVVAPLGTALTEAQGRLLKRYADEVVISFDSDAAGQTAALRGLDILDGLGFRVKVLTIPSGKDPDDFIRANGAAAFRELIPGALTLVDYKIASLRRKYGGAGDADGADGGGGHGGGIENQVLFLKETVRVLAKLGDAIEREMYAARISSQYGVSERAVLSEIDKLLLRGGGDEPNRYGPSGGKPNDTRAGGAITNSGPPKSAGFPPDGGSPADGARQTDPQPWAGLPPEAGTGPAPDARSAPDTRPGAGFRPSAARESDELFIVALLSLDNTLWDVVAEKLLRAPDSFESGNARRAAEYLCTRVSDGREVTPGELMRFFTQDEGNRFAAIVTGGCHCEDNRRAMEQKIVDMDRARNQRRMREILRRLETGELQERDAADLRAQLSEVTRKIGRGRAG
ncbi:MAG: DNA primase [Clostridiales bacterium]|jgi:DNA primase|nr:DNA primase [Clostridiales bacterium]